MSQKTLEIGITGGIGAGKSTIARIFGILGAPLYDADSRAKYLMANEPMLITAIKKIFGEEAYFGTGDLNRAFLASKVFSDIQKTQTINALVHPAVAADYEQWKILKQNAPYVLREAALMIESGAYKQLDKLITVFAPEDLRIARVALRDPQRTKAEIKAIIQKQLSEEEKIKLAHYVIYNDETQAVLPQVLKLHQEFTQKTNK